MTRAQAPALLFTKAAIAFVALPGVVAYLVPGAWVWLTDQALRWSCGFVPIALGTSGLLWCVRDFHASGKGTLAPWAPPKTLVTVGLYRYTRNPMYACVFAILIGWAISFASIGLSAYALAVGIAFHLRVVFGEEPWLARTHGVAWQQYAQRVRRWL